MTSATGSTLDPEAAELASSVSVNWSGCTSPSAPFATFTASLSGAQLWGFTYDSTTGTTTGTINLDNNTATITGAGTAAGCTAQISGAVYVTYQNSNSQLTVSGNPTLHVVSTNGGCAGLLNANDIAGFFGTYTVSPEQTVTEP